MYERGESRRVDLPRDRDPWPVLFHVEAVARELVEAWLPTERQRRAGVHINTAQGWSRGPQLSEARAGVRGGEELNGIILKFEVGDARTLNIETSVGFFNEETRMFDRKLFIEAHAPQDQSALGIVTRLNDAVNEVLHNQTEPRQIEPYEKPVPVTWQAQAKSIAMNPWTLAVGGGLVLAFFVFLFGWN